MAHVFRCFLGLAGLLALLGGGARAQSTAGYGDWQLHLPTNHPLQLADAGDRVYVATENAFYYLDKTLNTTRVLSSRDGLSDVGVTDVAYDSVTRQTVLVYRNTNIDILRPNGSVRNLSDVLRKSIQGEKTIHHVSVSNGKAYLGTSFGLVVVGLNKLEISDTYSNIGPGGAVVSVYDAVVSNGTLFAATSAGLLRGSLSSNLLDYHSWTQDLPVPLGAARQRIYPYLATYAGQVYAAVEGSGSAVYRYQAGSPGVPWRPVPGTYTGIFRGLRGSSAGLFIVDDLSGVRRIDRNNAVMTVIPGMSSDYTDDAVRARDGSYYVAYYNNGLQRVRPGTGQANERFEANGPASNQAFSILADARTNIVDVFTGGYTERYLPSYQRNGFCEYANGQWTTYQPPTLPGTTATTPNLLSPVRGTRTPDGTLYVGAYGGGLLEWKGTGQVRHFGEGFPAGSPLFGTFGLGNNRVEITDLTADAAGGVWMVNRHLRSNTSGLLRLNPATATWQVIPWVSGLEALERVELDDNGYVWASVSRKTEPTGAALGIFAIDPALATPKPPRFFSVADGLPDNQIYELTKDRRGYIWAATIKGVAYFNAAEGPFTTGTSFVTPIVTRGEGTGFPALFTDAVRAIAVDGGDRKWFATDHGLWLFSPDADEALLHFTKANSPLPSDRVVDVKVNDKTGEVWIATDAGVVAYRGAATVTEGEPHCTAVFPNPVRPDFAGTVGIAGLANNALVKITDVAGHLVYATKASGGTATWNLTTPDGQRVRSGMYLVLSSDADGKNGCVSKVAVLSK